MEERRPLLGIRRRRLAASAAAVPCKKESNKEGAGLLQPRPRFPLPMCMVPLPTHQLTTGPCAAFSSAEASPPLSPRRTRIRRGRTPLSFPFHPVVLLPRLLLFLLLHVTSAATRRPTPSSPSLPPSGFLVPTFPSSSSFSSSSFTRRNPTHPPTITYATKPASSSSSSSAASSPPSSPTANERKLSGRNSSDPSLLDLVGFRAGLDESYRLKRQSALLTLSGQEEGAREEGGLDRGGGLGGDRKPWGYWKDISQIKISVEEFWEGLNISSSAIPNEMLLRLYDAHGLRHAIYKQGGRETLAYLLGTDYIPGDFRQAMSFPEVQLLVAAGVIVPHADPQSQALLSPPPSLPASQKLERRLVIGPRGGAVILNERLKTTRFPPSYGKHDKDGVPGGWKYQNRTVWSMEKLADECYLLAEEHSDALHLPLLFFPKISDLVGWGRANMINTIRRYGGYESVVSSLGFIPFSQWNYFCRFYLLMKDLKTYLDEEEEGRREMPTLRDVKRAGYHRLYSEVARNGGRKLVAARLGLPLKAGSGERGKFASMISYGTFDFDFGVSLLEYIMNKCWAQHPKERAGRREREKVNLFLPTAEELVGDERKDLLEKIIRYGGFENVARRLQLGFKS